MIDFAFVDSGIGGLPYFLHMKKVCSESSCVYIADTKNFPYGEKTHDDIVKCVIDCVQKIIERFNPCVIILACNTMTVNALSVLRDVYPDRQFVGTVPAIKVAGEISKKHCIGLLATNSTVKHPYNQDLKNHFAGDCKMILRGDPDLISFIEKDFFTASEKQRQSACKPAVDFFRDSGCDVIILGCTHFLNVKDDMQAVAGNDITVVDSLEGVVKHAINVCGALRGVPAGRGSEQRSVSEGKAFPCAEIYITGKNDVDEYKKICAYYDLKFSGIF